MELKLIKERFEHDNKHLGKMFSTYYENDAYMIFLNESEEGNFIKVINRNLNRNRNYHYPSILGSGVNISSTGTLSIEDLDKHIERLEYAKATYKLILERFPGVNIV